MIRKAVLGRYKSTPLTRLAKPLIRPNAGLNCPSVKRVFVLEEINFMRMSRSEFGSAVLATAAVALFTLGPFPAQADMMAACETDIATHCSDVGN